MTLDEDRWGRRNAIPVYDDTDELLAHLACYRKGDFGSLHAVEIPYLKEIDNSNPTL